MKTLAWAVCAETHLPYIFGHTAQLQHSGFSAVGAELLFPQIFFKTQAAHALED